MIKHRSIYYLPGQGGYLHKGLGQALLNRGLDLTGREIQGEFKKADFGQQVAMVTQDLQSMRGDREALIIANSFGAYLFLHAQADMPPVCGHVLLLSPIVGAFGNRAIGMGFIPPRANKLLEIARAGLFCAPAHCAIHVGSEDWQSNPDLVQEFGERVGIPVTVVGGSGHALNKDYVTAVLDAWLPKTKAT